MWIYFVIYFSMEDLSVTYTKGNLDHLTEMFKLCRSQDWNVDYREMEMSYQMFPDAFFIALLDGELIGIFYNSVAEPKFIWGTETLNTFGPFMFRFLSRNVWNEVKWEKADNGSLDPLLTTQLCSDWNIL